MTPEQFQLLIDAITVLARTVAKVGFMLSVVISLGLLAVNISIINVGTTIRHRNR